MNLDLPRSPLAKPVPLDPEQIKLINWAWEKQEARERGLGEASEPQERGLGPEAGTGQVAGGPSGNTITCTVQGLPQVAPVVWDLAWFFSLNADVVPNTTYALAAVDVLTEDSAWTMAQTSLYLGLEPMFLVNANIVAASTAAVIAASTLRMRRSDPFGTTAGTFQPQAAYQNAADFQTTRGQFPIAEAIDAWTWVRIVTPSQAAPGGSYTVAFFFGPRQDRRGQVPRISPQLVRSVNR